MNSNQFISLLQKGNKLEKEDFHQMVKLHESFPYFQIPAVLAAKYEYERSKGGPYLHSAAVLSPNRAWLKYLVEQNIDFLEVKEDKAAIIESNADEAPSVVIIDSNYEAESAEPVIQKEEEVAQASNDLVEEPEIQDKPELISTSEPVKEEDRSNSPLITPEYTEASEDRPELAKSTSEEEVVPAPDNIILVEEKVKEDRPELVKSVNEPPKEDAPTQVPEAQSGGSRQKIVKQLEENLAKLKTDSDKKSAEEEPTKEKEPAKSRRRRSGEDLIDTIKKKEKREIKDSKKKEQNDIIKAFGNKSIRMAAIKENEEVNKLQDLSISSTKINDRMVSESYAKLLTQQGKKAAAKEIYKKLILKFPQKKAYFADLIKQLDE